jgi:hypothetical protein
VLGIEPTSPKPASIWKFTRSIEFPALSEMLLALEIVVEVDEKNICSVLWAVVASSKLSCWRIYRTPTLAKSNISSVAVNAVLELVAEDAAEVVVAVAVDDAGGQLLVKVLVTVMVVVGGVVEEEVTSIVSVVVDDGPAMTVMVAMASSFTAAASIIAADVPVVSIAALRLPLWPSKVTREFWVVQLRLPELSLERTAVAERATEKLA